MNGIPIVTTLLAGGLMAVLALGAGAEPPGSAKKGPTSDASLRERMLPVRALHVDPSLRIIEGPRMLGDRFPYLAREPRRKTGARSVELVPSTLASFLAAGKAADKKVPLRVGTDEGAIAAVRLFLAGPVVSDAETAERVLAAGRALAGRLKHLDVTVSDHRPKTWAPQARALPRTEATDASPAWAVSLVAFELDRMLRLVHVEATVQGDGILALESTPIVNGPMTSWQTAAMGEWTDAMERRQQAMRAEAAQARRVYAKALRPARSLDAFWAAGRVRLDMGDIRALFGEPDRDIGSGIHMWTYDLPDGTSIVFGEGGGRPIYVRHVRGAKRPLKGFESLGTIYAGR